MNKLIKTNIPWIPVIRENWNVVRVKNVFFNSKEKAHQENPVILSLARNGVKVRDISNNEGQLAESYYDYNPVMVGDLLLNPMDLYSGANCNVSEVEGVISPAYANLRSKKEINSKYFDYFFKTQYWTMAMFAHGKGVSFDNRWTINNESIMNYEIPFPNYEEQNKIVSILNSKISKIDSLIANQEKQIKKIGFYKQQLITEIVTKGIEKSKTLKDSGVEWIGNIPENWNIYRVKNLGNTQNGISKGSEYFGAGFPFVSYGDVYKNWSLMSDTYSGLIQSNDVERKKYSVKYGDILFTRTSETIEEVGFSSVCLENIDNAVYAGFLIRLRPNKANEILETSYAKYFFRANLLRKYLVKEMNLVTRASLTQELLGAMSVIVPPKAEQLAIVDYLDDKITCIDKLISIKQEKIKKLQDYKKSIIYEYVTGKKEVK